MKVLFLFIILASLPAFSFQVGDQFEGIDHVTKDTCRILITRYETPQIGVEIRLGKTAMLSFDLDEVAGRKLNPKFKAVVHRPEIDGGFHETITQFDMQKQESIANFQIVSRYQSPNKEAEDKHLMNCEGAKTKNLPN